MSDEVEVRVGSATVPDAELLGWQLLAETVFAEADFCDVPLKAAPSFVRRALEEWSDEPGARCRFLMAPGKVVRRRMAMQGYTGSYCRRVWEIARSKELDRWTRQFGSDASDFTFADLAHLRGIDFATWLSDVRERHERGPDSRSAQQHQPWQAVNLLRSIPDPLVALVLTSLAFERSPVWMDCSFLYEVDTDRADTPQELARREGAFAASFPSGKIIVLTEGRSDARLVSAALRSFYPEYADAFQFLDFDEFRIEGGASPLARMVKVLSGARMENRVLGLFDNDAAGHEAMMTLSDVALPPNVRLMSLPDTRLAARYPTLGPGGSQRMDVNGSAAAIELYLGRTMLTSSDGSLRPVRWTEWRERIGRYQGAVGGKAAVAERFLAEMAAGEPADLRRRFPEMRLLLDRLMSAFEDYSPPTGVD